MLTKPNVGLRLGVLVLIRVERLIWQNIGKGNGYFFPYNLHVSNRKKKKGLLTKSKKLKLTRKAYHLVKRK